MDFLDPRKRRAHTRRLLIGYGLMAIAISLGAIILVYGAYGYGFNTKTGDIVQNGLLFVDSQPGGADIYLNDKPQGSRTSARLVLPAGNYKLTLKKDGYRTWERSFTLTEHSIARYVYPFLFPLKPQISVLKNYSAAPPLISQSPDRRWLLVEVPQVAATKVVFDEYDTANPDQPPKSLTMPAGLLTIDARGAGVLSEVEWSTDNKHLLLKNATGSGSEFIIFERDNPAQSFNVNKLFNISPTLVTLRNKKVDQFYIFYQATGDLQVGRTSDASLTPLLTHILSFKPNGPDLISYVTNQNSPPGQVVARIWDGNKSYSLYTFAAGNNYLIDMAQFQGHWYYVAGSDSADRVNVYKDPLSGIKNPSIGKAIPLLSLNIKGATKVSFSNNTRFVEAENGQEFSVYDFETQSAYHYTLPVPLAGLLRWMDGHRLIGESNSTFFVTDYDSANQQLVVPTSFTDGGFFDPGYKYLFTMAAGPSGTLLERVDMRAGVDLPKQ